MPTLNYILLSVTSPLASAPLYEGVFGVPPVQRTATFVLFVLPGGLKVGLWSTADTQPTPRPAGGVELSFTVADRASVVATFEAWQRLGLTVVQEPTDMDFGFTCVLADPDGHRLRPFVLADAPR